MSLFRPFFRPFYRPFYRGLGGGSGESVIDPPVNTELPVITGDYIVGQELTCSTGVWANSPTSYSYQWQLGGVGITGATSNTYTPADEDAGEELDCVVTATNLGGSNSVIAEGEELFGTMALAGRFLHFKATDGPLDASGTPLTVDGAIDQWLDLSGQENHLTAFDAARRMVFDADGGPNGKPVATSLGKLLRRATLTGGTQTGYTVIMLCRIRPEIAIADCLLSTDTSSVNRLQSQSAGGGGVIVGNFNASSGNSGNMGGIPTGNTDFCLLVVECTDGVVPKGRFGINGLPPAAMQGTPGAYVASAFSLGARYGNLNPSEMDVYEVILLTSPTLEDGVWNKIREYAAREFGITSPTAEFPSLREGLETFQRANTPDNNLGTSESGHRYNVVGTGAAQARLVDKAYSMVAPWGTSYVFPLTTIKPRVIGWDYEFRPGAGAGANSTNAVGLSNNVANVNKMVHIIWNTNTLQVQRFNPPNPNINLPLITYDGMYLSGRIRLEFYFAAGVIAVTGPDGVVTVLDWNAVSPEPLSDFNTWNFFYEIISAGTNTLVAAYTRFYWE